MSLSEGECCRLFQRMLHTSPMEYAISCRIRESLSLLVAGHLSVTEIAQRTGFSWSSYFTETFRRVMGMTPSASVEMALQNRWPLTIVGIGRLPCPRPT